MSLRPPFDREPERQTTFTVTREPTMAEPDKPGLWAECREWWKLHSVKLAALASAISGVLTANPDILIGLLAIIPADHILRLVFSLGVAGVVFLLPLLARLWPQPKLHEDAE